MQGPQNPLGPAAPAGSQLPSGGAGCVLAPSPESYLMQAFIGHLKELALRDAAVACATVADEGTSAPPTGSWVLDALASLRRSAGLPLEVLEVIYSYVELKGFDFVG